MMTVNITNKVLVLKLKFDEEKTLGIKIKIKYKLLIVPRSITRIDIKKSKLEFIKK